MAADNHFQNIYAHHAEEYDLLVSREDPEGNLLKAIREIIPIEGLEVIEMGAGTGRVTRILAPFAKSIHAFDAYEHMLETAASSLTQGGFTNWKTEVADNRSLPAADASADLSIEGWSFGHTVGWEPDRWRQEIGKMVSEMLRVLRPGGTAIIIETLGTGNPTPVIPRDGLGAYYAWLEWEHGFSGRWERTDIAFRSVEEAERLTRFFFGDWLADRVVRENLTTVPECTGIWWRRK